MREAIDVGQDDGSRCELSVIVPVFREEATITDLLAHLRRLDPERSCEIVVVDGDPHARTLAAIHDHDVVTVTSPQGRGPQMNAGAAVARGDILLFLHADTQLPADGLHRIRDAMCDPGHVGGAFQLAFDSDRPIYRIMAKAVNIRTHLNKMPYGDQGLFVRRRYFLTIGGFAPIPIMEDVDLVRRIRRGGGRLKILDAVVVTSRRRMEGEGIIWGVARNVLITFLYNLGVSPNRLARWYRDDYRIRSRRVPVPRKSGVALLRHRDDRS